MKYADYLDNVQNLGYFNQKGGDDKGTVDELIGLDKSLAKHHYVNPSVLVKPIINLYHGCHNSSVYRQYLSDPKRLKN